MRSTLHRHGATLFALLLLAGGCSSRRTPPAQLEPDVLFQRGTEAFDQERYAQAIELLGAFTENHVGDSRVAEARMKLGRAYLARDEYLPAAGEFQRVVADFPADPHAADARLLTCEAYAELSPRAERDQEYTRVAISHCESVASLYPQTPKAERAAALVAEMRAKLAQKVYENGLFYFRRGAYDAALVYLTDAVNRYPEAPVAPAALLKVVQSYDRVGYEEEEAEARARLRRDYPLSAEARGLPG